MNNFLIIAFLLPIIGFQQSNGFEKSLPPNDSGEDSDEAIYIIKNGFNDFNSTVNAAENMAMHGFLEASKLFSTQPDLALHMIQDSIHDSKIKFLESGIPVLSSLGQALRLSNYKARNYLVHACQQTQYSALNVLEIMRNVQSSAIHRIKYDGNLSTQVIEEMRQDLQAGFRDMYGQIPITFQKAMKTVSNVRNLPTADTSKSQNIQAAEKNSDAKAIISELTEAAQESIKNGADASKVKLLRDSLIDSIGGIAVIGSFSEETFANFSKLADTDSALAKKLIEENTETIYKKIQEIFTNICLDFGAVGDGLTAKEIGMAYVAVENGSDVVTYSNNVAKKMSLDTLPYESNLRETVVQSAVNIAKNGKNAFYKNVLKGAKIVFDSLVKKNT